MENLVIQFAYSLPRRDIVQSFIETMLEGMYSCNLWKDEEIQGGDTTGCVTILIPTGENEDGTCNIRIDRKILMDAIHKFGLTKLKLD